MAKLKASVKLSSRGPKSFNSMGRRGLSLKQGQVVYLTKPSQIRALRSNPMFVVSIVEGKLPPEAPAKPPVVEEEDEDEEDEEEAGTPSPADDDEAAVDAGFSEADLKKQTKSELVALGAGEFDLELDSGLKKSELVKAILDAQASGDDEGDDDEADDD